MSKEHPSHVMRFSDSSWYDFVCVYCGLPENSKSIEHPCKGDFSFVDFMGVIVEIPRENFKPFGLDPDQITPELFVEKYSDIRRLAKNHLGSW